MRCCTTGSKFRVSTIDCEEVLHARDALHSWNRIISNGSVVESQWLRDIGITFISSMTQLLIHHLFIQGQRPIYGEQRADLDVWNGWLRALSDLDEYKSHFFGCQLLEGVFCSLNGALMLKLSTIASITRAPSWQSLSQELKEELMNILTGSSCTGHGYLQHAGSEWCSKYCLSYFIYPVLGDVLWKTASHLAGDIALV